MQLLAALHHILFPGQQLADLPNRVKLSREALEKRAEHWITICRRKLAVRLVTRARTVVGREGSCDRELLV